MRKSLVLALLVVGALQLSQAAEHGFVSIFDGKTLTGWGGTDMSYWSVEDGCLTGMSTDEHPSLHSHWIVWQGGEVGDFEIRLRFKISGTKDANSGIQFRTMFNDDATHADGYQADLVRDPFYMGLLYDEGTGRTFLAKRERETVIVKMMVLSGQEKHGKVWRPSCGDATVRQIFMTSEADWNNYHGDCPEATIWKATSSTGHLIRSGGDRQRQEILSSQGLPRISASSRARDESAIQRHPFEKVQVDRMMNMEIKTIVVLATLDTKGLEAQYLSEKIEKFGHKALVIDTGVMGAATMKAGITREEVALTGGVPLADVREHPTREAAAAVMAAGAAKIIQRTGGEAAAAACASSSLGGTRSGGNLPGAPAAVMRALPHCILGGSKRYGFNHAASGNVRAPLVDIKDITMMFSVTDILGLNPVMRMILANAAGAVCGMASVEAKLERGDKPLIAVTKRGITNHSGARCAKWVKVLPEAMLGMADHCAFLHAIGPGGRAMEQMMKEGLIGAVLDLATIEVSNEMYHALLAGGSERLTTAGKLNLPESGVPWAIRSAWFTMELETVPLGELSARPATDDSATFRVIPICG